MSREIDAMVAEKVMGYKFWREDRSGCVYIIAQGPGDREPWTGTQLAYQESAKKRYTPTTASELDFLRQVHPWNSVFKPSTDPAAAMQVVERMRELGYDYEIRSDGDRVVVTFYCPPDSGGISCGVDVDGPAKELCMTIARSALRAVGGEGGRNG